MCIIPSYAVCNGILWSSCGNGILLIRKATPDAHQLPTELWAWENLGGDAAVLIGHFVIDTLILIFIELDLFKKFREFTFYKLPPRDTTLELDEDVLAEEHRV